MMNKICSCCKQEKPIDCFSRNKKSKDGLKEYCKECAAAMGKRYRETHKDEIRERKMVSYRKAKEMAEEKTAAQIEAGPRKCSKCGIVKPVEDFYKRSDGGFRPECKTCSDLKNEEYRSKNRDKIIEQKREYHKTHKQEIDEYNHAYYQSHSDEVKERTKAWELEHPEQVRARSQMDTQARRSRDAGLKTEYSLADWELCKEYFSNEGILYCAYCGKPVSKATQDHIIPISSGGPYTRNNIVPVCMSCNSSKGNREFFEWYRSRDFYSEEREKRIMDYLQANTERAS